MKEFLLFEDMIFDCYQDQLIEKSQDVYSSLGLCQKLPLIAPTFQKRVKVIQEQSFLNSSSFENPYLENFPKRNYFKIDLFFKLFLSFVLFGSSMKGINIPIFITMLILYYWYFYYYIA